MSGAEVCEQLSLFTVGTDATAICLLGGEEYAVRQPEPWERRIFPEGEYAVDWPGCKGVSLVLRPVGTARDKVKKGHEFYHFFIGAQLYAGAFTANEEAAGEFTEEGDTDDE